VDAQRREPSVGALTLVQFFVGGFVLFVGSGALMMMSAPTAGEYDGIMSMLSIGITAVIIAVSSMIVAMLVGLPVRLVPSLRSRWRAHGELTVAGAALGLLVCAAAVAAMATNPDERGAAVGPDIVFWALVIGWALFAFSVAHFVWPARWKRDAKG